ncbi:MAG: helix-turn-helix domain-containing protein [Leptospiraceae bacterium]|nr:helix-turn-helix domain-containing protein [Leptospiraceae bacterium]
MKKDQFNELFSYLGLSQRAFAKKYDLPQPTLSNIVNGKMKALPVEVIYRVHKDFGISLKWLVSGEGDMLEAQNSEALTEEEQKLFREIRRDPRMLSAINGILESLKKIF